MATESQKWKSIWLRLFGTFRGWKTGQEVVIAGKPYRLDVCRASTDGAVEKIRMYEGDIPWTTHPVDMLAIADAAKRTKTNFLLVLRGESVFNPAAHFLLGEQTCLRNLIRTEFQAYAEGIGLDRVCVHFANELIHPVQTTKGYIVWKPNPPTGLNAKILAAYKALAAEQPEVQISTPLPEPDEPNISKNDAFDEYKASP